MTSILDNLIERNEYPIVFIGSGISKRYLKDFPAWEELLEEYWEVTGETTAFYSYLSTLSASIKKDNPGISLDLLEFLTNIKTAQRIAENFNTLFLQGKIKVEGLDYKTAYQDSISPFKKSISERFNTYKFKSNVENELSSFKALIERSQILVTTNYDNFIEDTYRKDSQEDIITYIRNNGFFNETEGWAELFKIHGSIESPNSIVITESDYEEYNQNKILISAKLLTAMVNSPIVFLGYSLKDVNVQNLISDFASQLPDEDSRRSAQRIVVVEWEEGQQEIIEEQVREYNNGWNYTLIKTDNYKHVFDKLTEINQGLSPAHVRKYNRAIKDLVVARGKRGALESVLLSPEKLDDIVGKINDGKPIVLNFGEDTVEYQMPNMTDYFTDYVFDKGNIMPEVALRYVSTHGSNSRFPFAKYIKEVDIDKITLSDKERINLNKRIEKQGKLNLITNSVNKYNKIDFETIEDILSKKFPKSKEVDVIVYNTSKFNLKSLEEYIKQLLLENDPLPDGNFTTYIRKIVCVYDLLLYGDVEPI